MAYLLNPAVFVSAYLLFMLPTYMLPYFGSNSIAVKIAALMAALAAGAPVWPIVASFIPTLLHLGCLTALCVMIYVRGKAIGKVWLLVFPCLAFAFDIVPLLTWIPLVPTIMHLLAIVLGVVPGRAAVTSATVQVARG